MATEQEELRLTVTLVDNASAGLTKMREQITGLSSGQAKQSMDAFQRSQKEMGNQLKELAAVATGGTQAVIGMISKFGALGLVTGRGRQSHEAIQRVARRHRPLVKDDRRAGCRDQKRRRSIKSGGRKRGRSNRDWSAVLRMR